MISILFIKGMLIGLIFGVPAGAIGALTIQRTIEKGFAAGIITGLGSSAADLIYGCASVFGITIISNFITRYQFYIQLPGGFLIIALGISILKNRQKPETDNKIKGNLAFYFLSSFGAAIMNPATILSFIIAFTTFGISGNLSIQKGIWLLAGILTGTLCWWTVLAGIVAVSRSRITNKIYNILNIVLGSFMLVFGVVMIIKGIKS